ncbi:hypothetical protein [Roseovarius Plymouth podovirus 1]|uniref:Uncharacterized protein n=2 Tax=Roseovarius Plymouth podovirus 1 TaxID=926474 RepID=K4Q553_9CAUD|nr:hypothetical protein HYO70_gp08 [Roseovarius Plymouth podovirus 1]CBW47001.1 hypothetical protein [Roseovarius sp. 217 phage 1]CBX87938.1 hypothetical protein [Roseovarius Plymouth podovirus 1]
MWNVIKALLVIAAFLFQFVIVYGAESIAEETGDYGQAIYEMLWLLLLFFIAESMLKEDKDG